MFPRDAVPQTTDDLLISFMAHPDTLLPMPTIDDPLQRFVSVIKFYLSGWHIKPPYVTSASIRVSSNHVTEE